MKDLPALLRPMLSLLVGEEWGNCFGNTARIRLFQRSDLLEGADREATVAARYDQVSRKVAFGVWGHNHIQITSQRGSSDRCRRLRCGCSRCFACRRPTACDKRKGQ